MQEGFTMDDIIPAGATPVATISYNDRYCCPFGSPYGFGDGLQWYRHPDEVDYSDARAFGNSTR